MEFLWRALEHWPAAGLLVALVALAAILRALLPGVRARVRRVVVLLALAGVASAGELGLRWLGYETAASMLDVCAMLLLAYTLVNLAVAAAFDWLLPRLGIVAAPIVYELVLVAGWAIATLAVATLSGFDLAGVAAASTVAVAILTISLQATLGNVVGGIAIQLDRSIKDGDWLVLDGGREGRVREVRWRHTVLQTRDGNLLLVPNSALLSMTITVVGRPAGRPGPYRVAMPFVTDIRTPPERVVQVVEDALRSAPLPNIAADPPPDCIVRDLGGRNHGYLTFEARVWVHDPLPDAPTNTGVALRVHTAMRRAGIAFGAPTTGLYGAGIGGELEQRGAAEVRQRGRALLDRLPLFASLTPQERDALASRLEDAPYSAGDVLVRQGWPARRLYLLAEGTVRVVQDVDGGQLEIAVLTGPTFFGERALMKGEARTATVVAATVLECYRLEKAAFDELRGRPEIAAALEELQHRRPEVPHRAEASEVTGNGRPEPLLDRIRQFFRL
jgi:small-conductance mechanosensitive channel